MSEAETPQRPNEAGQILDITGLSTENRGANEAAIRALCRNAYLGQETSLARILGRYKMFVDTADVGISSHLLMDGYWEMWTTEAMVATIQPGATVVDVGANLGYFTLLMADLVGPSGQVHAFEPNSAIAKRLRQSVAVNGFAGRTVVHQLGLGDHHGLAGFHVEPGEPGGGHVVPVSGDGPTVPVSRLDSLGIVPDFVKIDAEGAEAAVWRGMAGILALRRPLTVFLEFVPDRYENAGNFLDEILRHGFLLSRIDPGNGVEPTSRAAVLQRPANQDQMLVLSR
nr:FkbM family methyltransferase [Polymorphobacter sp.]